MNDSFSVWVLFRWVV